MSSLVRPIDPQASASRRPRLQYAEFGKRDGRAVLFLHGWPDSWFSFSRVLALLPDDLRALEIDERGFGDSDRTESDGALIFIEFVGQLASVSFR